MNSFIINTAKDYELEPSYVEWIYEHFKDRFYEKLEEVINERSKSNN
jgi:hypothetical protein